MKPIIFPYKFSSTSAKNLAESLNTKRVRKDGKYKYRQNDIVINWGASSPPKWQVNGIKVLNSWNKVKISHNKLTALNVLKNNNVNTIEFTTDIGTAKKWIKEGNIVMCRTQLENHSGFGIIVSKQENELVDAPLYTKYVKGSEFRIHVIKKGDNYTVFDIQQKRKRVDFKGEPNNLIRSHHRGWNFCRNDIDCPLKVTEEAIKTLKSLELDFGAIDIKYNKHYNQAFVLECNSSPNMEGETLQNYTHEFLAICNGH